jgi:MoaA/NifB/PqqE/SkfB family radical SAM enzyme
VQTLSARPQFDSRRVAFREMAGLGLLMCRGDMFEVTGPALDLVREIRHVRSSVADLGHLLASKYHISQDEGTADASAFVLELQRRGIIAGPRVKVSSTSDVTPMHASISEPELECWTIARERRIPLKCKLNVTYRCNIACKFCYNGPRPGLPGPFSVDTELQLPEVERILRELYDEGTFILSVTGGEPFARTDILDVLKIAEDVGFGIEILTNGTLLSHEIISALAASRVQIVFVPLFGASPTTHDAFVRIPGSFERACKSIRGLVEAGVEVGVRCTITRLNFSEWRELRALVESLGARYLPNVQIHLSSDRRVDQRAIRLGDEDLAELFGDGLEINPGFKCHVGLARVDVMPNGDVALCSLLTEPLGNLRTSSFAEIWHSSPKLEALRGQLWGPVTCTGCHSRGDEAYRCSADALFDQGSFDEVSVEARRVISVADLVAGRH